MADPEPIVTECSVCGAPRPFIEGVAYLRNIFNVWKQDQKLSRGRMLDLEERSLRIERQLEAHAEILERWVTSGQAPQEAVEYWEKFTREEPPTLRPKHVCPRPDVECRICFDYENGLPRRRSSAPVFLVPAPAPLWVPNGEQCGASSADNSHSCTRSKEHADVHVEVDPFYGNATAAWL